MAFLVLRAIMKVDEINEQFLKDLCGKFECFVGTIEAESRL